MYGCTQPRISKRYTVNSCMFFFSVETIPFLEDSTCTCAMPGFRSKPLSCSAVLAELDHWEEKEATWTNMSTLGTNWFGTLIVLITIESSSCSLQAFKSISCCSLLQTQIEWNTLMYNAADQTSLFAYCGAENLWFSFWRWSRDHSWVMPWCPIVT